MLLTKIEKNILKYCIKQDANSIDDLEPLITKYGIYEIRLAFRELDAKNMFSYCIFADGGIPYSFALSFKALHHTELSLLEVKSFILKSVLTPMLVSALTTLIIWIVRSKLL